MTTTTVAAGQQLEAEEHTFTSVELFLFSAVSWHPHRIHFDQDYTRHVEGHQDLLVHGPLQAVHLVEYLRRQLPGARLDTVQYRHRAPLHVGVPATLGGEIVEVANDGAHAEVDLWMTRAGTDERTTVGHVSVRLTPSGD